MKREVAIMDIAKKDTERVVLARTTATMAALIVLGIPSAALSELQPSLTLDPSSDLGGSAVEANGSEFLNSACGVDLFFDSVEGPLLGSASVDEGGAFGADITIPEEAAAGAHLIVAQGHSFPVIPMGTRVEGVECLPSDHATATFTVTLQGPFHHDPVTPNVLDLDVRELPIAPPWQPGDPVKEVEDLKEGPESDLEALGGVSSLGSPEAVVGSVQESGTALQVSTDSSLAVISFDGMPNSLCNGNFGLVPPDTVGDVGPNHYIQMVNSCFSIFDKDGNQLAGPSPINSLWSSFGGPCETLNSGDPVVQYDHLADRWLLSQFALPGGTEGFHECVAISQTSDPVTGGWYLYDFNLVDAVTGNAVFPDYPKIGVWPDAYYMSSQRSFSAGFGDVWAFERGQMLNGDPAALIQFAVASPTKTIFLMPSDLEGPPPAAGTPNFYLRQVDGERFGGGGDRLEMFAFSVDFANPSASTFTALPSLPTAPFDSILCSSGLLGACIPQPGTAPTLETLTVWPMWRLQYRNFGSHETLVINHTVDVDGADHAGIRWYELRRPPAGTWSIFQQATHSPDEGAPGLDDDVHRWMGSVAMDSVGNMALGYSVSSNTVFPGIWRAGRLVGDPLNTMAQGEVIIVDGGGSQTSGSRRWGNYSSMNVDPVDDCTFWFTTEYYETTSSAGWQTRIAAFRFPSCEPPPPTNGKVELCHKGRKAISVSTNAVPAHLRHGDTLGACP
jgi:hypothetical protein